MIEIFIIGSLTFLLMSMGYIEKKQNEKRINNIPIRINVNGIRGKSTATRLITSVLHEAGYRTMGKTTGTAARKMFPFRNLEEPINRRPEGANIKEQLRTIHEASTNEVDALVCECMAVRPAYQDTYQNQMFKGNIVIIVNVLEDHLDEMGPTLNEIAYTFSKSIPYNGILVTIEDEFTPFFKEVAKKRNTTVLIARPDKISKDYIEKFEYVLFPENIAIALSVAESLNIPEEVAYRGMLKANADPGALKIKEIQNDKYDFVFVNAFAANEPASSLNIWDYVKQNGYNVNDPIVIFNGRPDRGDRTEQFARDFFQHIPNAYIIGMGQSIRRIDYYYKLGLYNQAVDYLNRENVDPLKIFTEVAPRLKNGTVVLAVGNIHGDAEELLEIIDNLS